MALFGKKKPQEQPRQTLEAPAGEQASPSQRQGAAVKVLGSGCAACNQLEEAARAALKDMGMDTTIEHVRDFAQIAAWGVMSTPALVVDGKVVSYGKVLKKEEVVRILQNQRPQAGPSTDGERK